MIISMSTVWVIRHQRCLSLSKHLLLGEDWSRCGGQAGLTAVVGGNKRLYKGGGKKGRERETSLSTCSHISLLGWVNIGEFGNDNVPRGRGTEQTIRLASSGCTRARPCPPSLPQKASVARLATTPARCGTTRDASPAACAYDVHMEGEG